MAGPNTGDLVFLLRQFNNPFSVFGVAPIAGEAFGWDGNNIVMLPIGGGGGSGTVTSVALTAASIFTVNGSPVTTAGTLDLELATQAPHLILAGPGSGSAAAPTFRALIAADLPDLSSVYQASSMTLTNLAAGNTFTAGTNVTFSGTWPFITISATGGGGGSGTVTSVAATVPSFLTVTGSPITSSGTLAFDTASQAQNLVFASPSGASGKPVFRAVVSADLPSILNIMGISNLTTNGYVTTSGGNGALIVATSIPIGSLSSSGGSGLLRFTGGSPALDNTSYLTTATATTTYQLLDGDLTAIAALSGTNNIYYRSAANTWTSVTIGTGLTFSGGTLTSTGGGGSGTVTSVALSTPAIFTVSGSPVTGTGTLTFTSANQNANTAWAGPTSGSAAAPAFRSLIGADLPGVMNTQSTSYTVVAADYGKTLLLSSSSANTLTLDPTMPVGFYATAIQTGTGQFTIASSGSGSVVNRQSQFKSAGNYAAVGFQVISNSTGSNATYVVWGDTSA